MYYILDCRTPNKCDRCSDTNSATVETAMGRLSRCTILLGVSNFTLIARDILDFIFCILTSETSSSSELFIIA